MFGVAMVARYGIADECPSIAPTIHGTIVNSSSAANDRFPIKTYLDFSVRRMARRPRSDNTTNDGVVATCDSPSYGRSVVVDVHEQVLKVRIAVIIDSESEARVAIAVPLDIMVSEKRNDELGELEALPWLVDGRLWHGAPVRYAEVDAILKRVIHTRRSVPQRLLPIVVERPNLFVHFQAFVDPDKLNQGISLT